MCICVEVWVVKMCGIDKDPWILHRKHLSCGTFSLLIVCRSVKARTVQIELLQGFVAETIKFKLVTVCRGSV